MNRDLRRREMQSLNVEVGEDVEWVSTLSAPEGRDLPVENELVAMIGAVIDDELSPLQADTVRRIVGGETTVEVAAGRGVSHQAISRQYQTGLAKVREGISGGRR